MSAGWTAPLDAPEGAILGGAERDAGPAGRSPPRGKSRPWLAAGLCAAAVAFAFYPPNQQSPAPSSPMAIPAGSATFRTRTDLSPLLSVQSTASGHEATIYQARRRDSDGERRDTLALGDPGANQAFFRVTARVMGPAAQPTDLFVELARQAAEVGLAVDRASAPQRDATDGGPLLVSELALEGAARRSCLGFRLGGPGVDLSGMACEAVGKTIERQRLDCLLNRLQATPAGAAKGLDKVLWNDTVRRLACARSPS